MGDLIQKVDGTHGVVQFNTTEYRTQTMYNLTVAEAHTFYVGDGDWLVHNCGDVDDAVPKWPDTVKKMEEYLNMPGTKKPDGPTTPGRNKVEWKTSDNVKITYESHPYHPNAPDWHRNPHWHLDTPGNLHQRFLPGDPMPGY